MKRYTMLSLLALGIVAFAAGCCCDKGEGKCAGKHGGGYAACDSAMDAGHGQKAWGNCPKAVRKAHCRPCKADVAVDAAACPKTPVKCPKCGSVLVIGEDQMVFVPVPVPVPVPAGANVAPDAPAATPNAPAAPAAETPAAK